MDNRKSGLWLLIISLVFAALMIAAGVSLDDPWKETIVFLLIAVWWVPFIYFIERGSRSRKCLCDSTKSTTSDGKAE